ncbi:MAG TPA: DmsC/YnfH family molybdoenzyme membrane anchor subunit [Casimicrobiaceae bacterium]|nr:DmsC/YnfH family molybdoenzyme membrane anchor subunit [Casimicrobiaceae bacterium]
MRPDLSVLLLTTLIGAGQGLFLALVTVQVYALFALLPAQEGRTFFAPGSMIAVVLLVAGLAASFLHLGRPERAWRAAAKWRTSWLSREVIVLPAFIAVVFIYGAAHFLGYTPVLAELPSNIPIDLTVVLGLIGTVLAFGLFLCTGMIYACLPFLREWASPLTVVNFTLMGGASGFTLAAALSAWTAPVLTSFLAGWALILTMLAFAGRIASLVRNAKLRPKSTLQTAIGVKHPNIVQKSQGFLGGSFNTREFFHGRSRQFLRAIRWVFPLAAFAIPAALLAASLMGATATLLLAAAVIQYGGLLAERWFFFAEANHPQNLYYQAVA